MNKRICTAPGCEKPMARSRADYCAMHYARKYRTGSLELLERDYASHHLCSIDGCHRQARNKNGLCGTHHEAQKRHGDPLGKATFAYRSIAYGYVILRVPAGSHPLARKADKHGTAQVPEHRVVLYASVGPGAHPCHWCGRVVRWEGTWPKDADALVPDHLNHKRDDNRLENLVVSCMPCNVSRDRRNASKGAS